MNANIIQRININERNSSRALNLLPYGFHTIPRKSTEDIENAHITSLKDKKWIVTMMDQSAEILCVLIGWLTVNTVYRLARNSWQAIPL